MAAATNFTSSTSGIQSPQLAQLLAQGKDKKIVPLDPMATPTSDSGKSPRATLTNQAPQLNPASNPDAPQGATYLDELAAYMASIIAVQALLANNQSQISQSQFTGQQDFVTLAQNQVTQAQQQYAEYQRELQAEQHESFWARVFGIIAAVVCIALAGLTGGLSAMLGAAVVTGFMMGGGAAALDNAIGGPSWAQGLINTAICIIGTAAVCGACGAISAGISAIRSGADEAAGDAAQSAAESAADAAINDAVNNNADELGEEAVENDNALADIAKKQQKSFLEKLTALGFNKMTLLQIGGQFATSLNPVGSLLTEALEKMGVSDKNAYLAGQIAGSLITMAAFGIAQYRAVNAAAASGELDELSQYLKNNMSLKALTQAQNGLNFTRALFQSGSGGFTIAAGATTLQIGSLEQEIGTTESNQTIYEALLEIMNDQSQAADKAFSNLMEMYKQNTNFNAFVQPGAYAAEILG